MQSHGGRTGPTNRTPEQEARTPAARTEVSASTAAHLAASGYASSGAAAALQRAVGNAAVVAAVQRDAHTHGPGCGHGGVEPVQRSAVHEVLRSPGRPLDDSVRSDMEARLAADFSDVRVHSDAAAKASAAEVGARAYTSGSHVVIGEGGGDRHTLAHELTHVIQQRQGSVAGTDNGSGLSVSDPSDRFEREAEANATRVMSGAAPVQHAEAGPAAPQSGDPQVQRAPDWKNNPTKQALAAQKALDPLNPLLDTLHHIVPKSDLAEFASWLDPAQLTLLVTTLKPLAPTAFTSNTATPAAVAKALKNVPANYAIGPRPETRTDDPGSSGPDLNYTADGAITPRSEELERVYDFIQRKRTEVANGQPVTATELNNEFLTPMVNACTAHGPAVGLDPNRTLWSGSQAARDQRRTHGLEPLV
ncbi:DUF4157 domain-containing protein [Streptomyces sp. NPDC051993]|uniref:eCIS core domain-containing protein n=1 Tax=Streptomyces sp. NPDC051993 TaxID=3155286 RepID=UPI003421789A